MGSNTRVRPRRTARDLLSTGDAKSLVDRATCLKNPAWQAVELKYMQTLLRLFKPVYKLTTITVNFTFTMSRLLPSITSA